MVFLKYQNRTNPYHKFMTYIKKKYIIWGNKKEHLYIEKLCRCLIYCNMCKNVFFK